MRRFFIYTLLPTNKKPLRSKWFFVYAFYAVLFFPTFRRDTMNTFEYFFGVRVF